MMSFARAGRSSFSPRRSHAARLGIIADSRSSGGASSPIAAIAVATGGGIFAEAISTRSSAAASAVGRSPFQSSRQTSSKRGVLDHLFDRIAAIGEAAIGNRADRGFGDDDAGSGTLGRGADRLRDRHPRRSIGQAARAPPALGRDESAQRLDIGAPIERLAPDPTPIALDPAPAHVGVECSEFYPQMMRGFRRGQHPAMIRFLRPHTAITPSMGRVRQAIAASMRLAIAILESTSIKLYTVKSWNQNLTAIAFGGKLESVREFGTQDRFRQDRGRLREASCRLSRRFLRAPRDDGRRFARA